MLGEDHSLLSEFPEYKDTITALAKSDETFLDEMKQYDLLDNGIDFILKDAKGEKPHLSGSIEKI